MTRNDTGSIYIGICLIILLVIMGLRISNNPEYWFKENMQSKNEINKTIYILWFQGFDSAPPVVKHCVESWKYYNPGWTIVLLDDSNLPNYITLEDYIGDTDINYTALSDVVRCILLYKYGGIWADATTFCNRPLDEWLPEYCAEGFFAFSNPGKDRMISTWFLYSEKDHYIMGKLLQSTVKYYKKRDEPDTYFWFHYLFNQLYASDFEFHNIWDNVVKIPADGPSYFFKNGFFGKLTPEMKAEIDNKDMPIYKLNYKKEFPEYDENKLIYYLYNTLTNPITVPEYYQN